MLLLSRNQGIIKQKHDEIPTCFLLLQVAGFPWNISHLEYLRPTVGLFGVHLVVLSRW